MDNSPYLNDRPEDRQKIAERASMPTIDEGWYGTICKHVVPGPARVGVKLRGGEVIADVGRLEIIWRPPYLR